MTDFQNYIRGSRYAKWQEEEGRRETWEETVRRYITYFEGKVDLPDPIWDECFNYIYDMKSMPSMRDLWSAGPALERDNVAGYNCSARCIGTDHGVGKHFGVCSFDELMYILLCGTGAGYSVERQFVEQLPVVGNNRHLYKYYKQEYFYGVPLEELSYLDKKSNTIIVKDSKYGWASATRILFVQLYNSNWDIKWDTSNVRPKGSPLKTFGGRASGPEPLENLFHFAVDLFHSAAGRKLTPLECHDLMCYIADIVVVGGVRRSAMISLTDLDDQAIRDSKHNLWYQDPKTREFKSDHPYRGLANISAVYETKPDMATFMEEWHALFKSNTGERGIFSREAAKSHIIKNTRRDPDHIWLTNPCSEIILRDGQFCNLSEVVIRPEDTFDILKEKVRVATILGTLQASLTEFVYLNPQWRKNTEQEALLGVSLTGIMDHSVMGQWGRPGTWFNFPFTMDLGSALQLLKEHAIEVNQEYASLLKINPSTAITCVKPSGTVSQLALCSSGIHPAYGHTYWRTVRNDKKDPMSLFLKDQGVYWEDDLRDPNNTDVFYFPVKGPQNTPTRKDVTAINQLELWKTYATQWCEHKPSCTVYIRDDEWLEVAAWLYKNFNILSGISFLPYDGGSYPQAPYQEITEEEYQEAIKNQKPLDWNKLKDYEQTDKTTGSQTLACTANSCEVI